MNKLAPTWEILLYYQILGGVFPLALTAWEGQERLEQRLLMTQLLKLNQYALEHELITTEIYRKMEQSIIEKYGTT